MRPHYKLVRIVGHRFLSANTNEFTPNGVSCFEYQVGETTTVPDWGVACYKRLRDANYWRHLDETMNGFNQGRPIAVLRVKPIGPPAYKDIRYIRGGVYEGGINYGAVEVLSIAKVVNKRKLRKAEEE